MSAYLQHVRSLGARLIGVFRSRRIEDELETEIESHLDMRAELLVARGMPPEEALREAKRLFGNRTHIKEEAREQDLLPRVESLAQDVHYGLRLLRRNPGFTTVVVLLLGLGIGLNAAMFSVFHQVLLAPLQFPQADRLYIVSSHARTLGDARRAMSGPDFRDFRDQNNAFTSIAAVIPSFAEVWTG